MTATGSLGVLKVGYQEAARLRDWCLTSSAESLGGPTIRVVGTVNIIDRYWSKQLQQGSRLGLCMGSAWWVWDVVSAEGLELFCKAELVLTGNPEASPRF